MIIALAASVVGQGLSALTPVFAAVIIDDAISTHRRAAWPWLLALVVAGLGSFVSAYLRRWIGGRVSLDVQFDLRNAIYERLQRLDFAGHDQLRTGQLVSRASTDLGLVQGLLAFLPIMLGNLVLLVVALVVMVLLLAAAHPGGGGHPASAAGGLAAACGARSSRRRGTPSSGPARSPAWSTKPSPGCGW